MHGLTTSRPNRGSATRKLGRPEEWQGGWIRGIHGKLTPRLGGKMGVLSKIFSNPVLPQIDDYYEPFTFDYQDLHRAPEGITSLPPVRVR